MSGKPRSRYEWAQLPCAWQLRCRTVLGG
jgi:hypothetical protein